MYLRKKSGLPMILAILASISMFSFVLFFFGTNSQPTRATKKILKRHEIVNLSPTEIGIFWESEKKEIGWVLYGTSESAVSTIGLDERDSENKRISSVYHYVLLKNLTRDTVYYYKIVSDNEVMSAAKSKPFQVGTLRSLPSTSTLRPAYGKVLQSNGLPADNVLVLYTQTGHIPLLAVTKTTGEWLIPLQYMVNKIHREPSLLLENSAITLEVLADDSKVTVINAPVNRTNPLPQSIIIGQDYELKSEETVLGAQASVTTTFKEIDIIFPREGAIVPAVRPLLKGLALPGGEVTLSINAKPTYATKLLADKKGEWKFELPLRLLAGSYSLTAVTENENARKITVTRKFTVAKSGEQVLGDATGSATTPTVTLAPSPTLTPTVTPATLPNTGFTPTPSILKDAGFSSDLLFYASFAFIILGAGFLIVF